MSINLGRGGSTQNIALARTFELGIDVVLVQEPLWNKQKNTTKDHPGYTYHLPNGGENVRPRAVTYTRIDDKKISATQIFPNVVSTGDYCWVEVNSITFLNVYKAPNDSTAIQPLLTGFHRQTPSLLGTLTRYIGLGNLAWNVLMDKEK